MTKVCILTQGEYSDYHIIGVFSSEERARAHVGPYADHYEFEEWTVDDAPDYPVGMEPWRVYLSRAGYVRGSYHGVNGIDSAREGRTWINIRQDQLTAHMFARDEEHAIKIANERRAFLLASDLWTDGNHTDAFTNTVAAATTEE